MGIITLVLTALQQLIPVLGAASQFSPILDLLAKLLPIVIKEAMDLTPMIKNIIDALRNKDAVTPEQLDQLAILNAQIDAAFEAAATDAEIEDRQAGS